MEIILGIDFGTTYSCISYFNKTLNKFEVVPNDQSQYTSPTMIFFDKFSDQILFGSSASSMENFNGVCVSNWKRIIGKSFDQLTQNELDFFKNKNMELVNKDSDNTIYFKLNYNNKDVYYTTLDLTIMYLVWIKSLIQTYLNEKELVCHTVITIPANFNNNSRTQLQEAYNLAGFKVLRVLNEPTSAALAYQNYDEKNLETENILIFDCGGGTTDLSLLEMDYSEQVFKVLDIVADNLLGGEDLTNNLYNWIMDKYKIKNNWKYQYKIKIQSELCKIALSNKKTQEYNINIENIKDVNDNEFDLNIKISQHQFIFINSPFFDKIRNLIKKIKSNSKETFLNKIIFIGGSTKFFYFDQLFSKAFDGIEILNSIDPDKSVAIGACNYSKSLVNNESEESFLLLDMTPLSLGVEVQGGLFDVIIPKGSILPITREKIFTNEFDNTSEIIVKIFQGESRFSQHNIYLNSLNLTNLNKKRLKGEMKIRVCFSINSSGIIAVKAEDFDSEAISNIFLSKELITHCIPENIDEIILSSEYTKTIENGMANKMNIKLSFHEKFVDLLEIFLNKRKVLLEIQGQEDLFENDSKNFTIFRFNKLFNNTRKILDEFISYSIEELSEFKKTFENEWHEIMFEVSTVQEEQITKIKNLPT